MKFVVAAVAIVAAIAALIFRPPHSADAVSAKPQPLSPVLHVANAVRHVPQIVVYVAGEVERPGVYRFAPEARATDAIDRAGGVKPDADTVAVNLAALLHDGDEIAVPKIGVSVPKARHTRMPHPRASRRPHTSRSTHAADLAPGSIDINSANENALEALPGIGPALAARIIAFREVNGPFDSVEDLADVSGVTPRMIDDITPYAIAR
jgi:competence protein ComEA